MGIVLVLLFVIICLLWPWIVRWIRGYMARRAEDMIRRMAGMPSRKEEERMKRARESGEDYGRNARGAYSRARRGPKEDGVECMREYAEDVEFTEIREYSSSGILGEDCAARKEFHESQVSDVEYTEVRERHRK